LKSNQPINSVGRPHTLDETAEKAVMERILAIQNNFSHITDSVIIREALDVAARKRQDEIGNTGAVVRVLRVGGQYWLKKFKQRNDLRTYNRKKPIEVARAIK